MSVLGPLTDGVCPCGALIKRSWIRAATCDFEYSCVPDEFTFVECMDCGSYVMHPRPQDVDIPKLYPTNYEPYQFGDLPRFIAWGRAKRELRRWKAIRHLLSSSASVVDIGCGNGDFLLALKEDGHRGELVGWDFPGAHLERLTMKGVRVVARPIDDAHGESLAADVAFLLQVIEHFSDPSVPIRAASRALKEDGLLLIETPSINSIDHKLFRKRHWGGYHSPRHLVLCSTTTLNKVLATEGFNVIKRIHLSSPAFWIQSLHHWCTERKIMAKFAPFFTLRNPVLVVLFTSLDLVLSKFRMTSNQRIIARKVM